MAVRIIIFLILNFLALAIGGLSTSQGVSSDWYFGLNQAPWTPPGWVFGFAWTSIMLCFSIYMAQAWNLIEHKKELIALYLFQWMLNTGWNPVFFTYHKVLIGAIIIVTLTILIGVILIRYNKILRFKTVFILPYFLWMIVASSLNLFILFNN